MAVLEDTGQPTQPTVLYTLKLLKKYRKWHENCLFFNVKMWLFTIPIILIQEIVYLIRHPWTFNWIAMLVLVFFIALGFKFTQDNKTLKFVVLTWGIGFAVYYILKINLNRRRPEVMKRHHAHYYTGSHNHKRRNRYQKKTGGLKPPGPRTYRTQKEIDEIIKKITSP